jgi:hypothetical protein
VHKFVRGVAQGSRYEARLSLVKEGVVMHDEWLQFHGAVESGDETQRISFAVPPLPAGRYEEFFDVYDACGLTASLSAWDEDDQQVHLLAGLTQEVDVEEAAGDLFGKRADQGLAQPPAAPERKVLEAERVALEEKLEVMAVQLEAMAAQLATAREQFRVLREQVQALGGRDAGSGPNAAGHVDLSSAVSPSSSSTPERCHPEDMLLFVVTGPSEEVLQLACSCCALMTHVHKFVRGVVQGSRYEARLSLVKEGVVMHEEWLQFHGAVESGDETPRISFAVPPLPAGRYEEFFDVYDACGLTASLSAWDEDDQQVRLLAALNRVVDVEEAVGNWFCERADQGLVTESEDSSRSSIHAAAKSVHIHRGGTGRETGLEGHDKSRDGPYETGFFDAMSSDARSPDSLLYHDDESFHGARSSRALQQAIWDLQHPGNCATSKLLILSEYHHTGLGATMHVRALQLLMGLDNGRVVVDDPNVAWDFASKGKEYCPSTGFDCYFLPLSNCSIPGNFKARGAVEGNALEQIRSDAPWVFVDNLNVFFSEYQHVSLEPKKFGKHIQKSNHWWMSQLIRYIVRPNALSVRNIIKPAFLSVFPDGVPKGLASVFIRWGDKITEQKLESVDAHLQPLFNLNISNVYIGSDSQSAIDEAISGYGHRFHFFYLQHPRERDGFVFFNSAYRIFGTSAIVDKTKRDLMELYLSVQGDVMTGELGSNWCRLAHELHDAVGKSSFPYYQIGECGSVCGHTYLSETWCHNLPETWCHGD